MAVLSYQVLACNMDIRASAHARLHMFMQQLQKITVFIQENGKRLPQRPSVPISVQPSYE